MRIPVAQKKEKKLEKEALYSLMKCGFKNFMTWWTRGRDKVKSMRGG